MTYIRTHNGHTFRMAADAISANRVDLDDIATSLAKQCRFNGHVPGFYSVAEHSVIDHVGWRGGFQQGGGGAKTQWENGQAAEAEGERQWW